MSDPFLPLEGHTFDTLYLGQTASYRRTVSASDVVGFAEISGDRNPVHLSEHFAATTPFKARIAHGLYTASLISAVLGTRLPGPGAIYLSQTLKFLAPVHIDDVVDVSVEVVELIAQKSHARLACSCSVGGKTVLTGEALVMVPNADQMERA